MEERIVYNNYDVWNDYGEAARENLSENGNADPSENEIWEEIYFLSGLHWEDEEAELQRFFKGSRWLAVGALGLWTGRHAAGDVFDSFEDFFYKAIKDCDFWKIWDENGHLFLKCSHHDGTNFFEIKRLSERGERVLEAWENNWNDPRSEEELHNNLWRCNLYTSLPHYAHAVYGCPKKEKNNDAKL